MSSDKPDPADELWEEAEEMFGDTGRRPKISGRFDVCLDGRPYKFVHGVHYNGTEKSFCQYAYTAARRLGYTAKCKPFDGFVLVKFLTPEQRAGQRAKKKSLKKHYTPEKRREMRRRVKNRRQGLLSKEIAKHRKEFKRHPLAEE